MRLPHTSFPIRAVTGKSPKMPLAAKHRRLRRIAALVLLAALAVPPLQVLTVAVWNPTGSPMQAQRIVEARLAGKTFHPKPLIWTPLTTIPQRQIHFIWASEDQRFFEHDGFDFDELRKAMNQPGGVRGASTITMQCARSVFLWQGRSYVRKALEAYYTFWMEVILSKRRILELYLNHIELGPGVYGIGAGARFWFHKPPAELTAPQMIALAAILPNPRQWSPVHPDATVLRKMQRIRRLAANAPFPNKELPSP